MWTLTVAIQDNSTDGLAANLKTILDSSMAKLLLSWAGKRIPSQPHIHEQTEQARTEIVSNLKEFHFQFCVDEDKQSGLQKEVMHDGELKDHVTEVSEQCGTKIFFETVQKDADSKSRVVIRHWW